MSNMLRIEELRDEAYLDIREESHDAASPSKGDNHAGN
jgi:hypothetical protein